MALILSAVFTLPLAAQVEPLAPGEGTRPTAQPPPPEAAREQRPAANPSRPAYSDNALIVATGWLELEAGLMLAFQQCSTFTPDGLETVPRSCNLQMVPLLAKLAVSKVLELRLGWDIYGSQTYGTETTMGVGDLYAQGKMLILLDVERPEMHRLAVLAEVRPGIGQEPIGTRGLGLSGYAIYSTFPSVLQVDVQAGVELEGIFSETVPWIPLSAVLSYAPIDQLVIYSEFVQRLRLSGLSASESSLMGGVGWIPTRSVVVDLSAVLGLTETLPDVVINMGVTVAAARVSDRGR